MENNGTYDMGGNVLEWNESAFDGTLDELDESRVLRGGDWGGDPFGLQSSDRYARQPGHRVRLHRFSCRKRQRSCRGGS